MARALSVVGWVVWAVSAVVGLAAGARGLFVLVGSIDFDQGSPLPASQWKFALAGVISVVVFLVLLHVFVGIPTVDGRFTTTVVVVGLLCAAPLWLRANTIDVTEKGFRQPHYGLEFDLHVYNATAEPIVVCVSKGDTCSTEARYPARLRAPGTTIAPRRRVSLRWPDNVYGTFTLRIASPLPAGARHTATFTQSEPSDNDDNFPNHDPFWPPPPQPPMPPPMPPLR